MKSLNLPNKELLPLIISQLEQDKQVRIMVTGKSMHPFFKDKQTYVTLQKRNTYHIFDVVLFKINETYYLHRILWMKKGSFFCQGDATTSYENPFYQDVFGKVIHFETNNKIIKSSSFIYQSKVFIWIMFKPFRRFIYKLVRLYK